MIPRAIHQTWRTREISKRYRAHWVASWIRLHPAWEYRLWTDEDLQYLAAEHYPQFRKLLETARGVVRADVGRALVLHRHGGLYADLDYMALRPMDSLIDGAGLCLNQLEGGYVHNALMAGAVGHQFFLSLAEYGLRRWRENPNLPPEFIAGPAAVRRILSAAHEARFWTGEQVCPIDWRKAEAKRGDVELRPQRYFPEAFAITFWRHNW